MGDGRYGGVAEVRGNSRSGRGENEKEKRGETDFPGDVLTK